MRFYLTEKRENKLLVYMIVSIGGSKNHESNVKFANYRRRKKNIGVLFSWVFLMIIKL